MPLVPVRPSENILSKGEEHKPSVEGSGRGGLMTDRAIQPPLKRRREPVADCRGMGFQHRSFIIMWGDSVLRRNLVEKSVRIKGAV